MTGLHGVACRCGTPAAEVALRDFAEACRIAVTRRQCLEACALPEGHLVPLDGRERAFVDFCLLQADWETMGRSVKMPLEELCLDAGEIEIRTARVFDVAEWGEDIVGRSMDRMLRRYVWGEASRWFP